MIKICLKTKRKKDIRKDSDAKIVLEKKNYAIIEQRSFSIFFKFEILVW